jgi:uncharacterized membrane protein YgcG
MNAPRSLLALVAPLLLLAGLAWAPPARATDIPGINGHLTDPGHTLSNGDKTTIEDKLNKIQQDTRIDVAGWVTDAPESKLDELGNEAYRRWNIAASWDNGVFFMIPRVGRVHIILDPTKPPELTPSEVQKIVDSDKPSSTMMDRVESISEAAGSIIRGKALHPRPAGKTDPARGRLFLYGCFAVLAAAVVLTIRQHHRQHPAPAV